MAIPLAPAQSTAPTSGSLALLADFKAALNLSQSDVSNDLELQSFLSAATAVVEHITGPVLPRSVTETHDGGSPFLVLRRRPVLAVASVTEFTGYSPLVLAPMTSLASGVSFGFTVDLETGTVVRRAGGYACEFPDGIDNVTVVYTAGFAVVPENIKRAALAQAAHFYQQTQLGGGGGRPRFSTGGASSGGAATGFGYGVPYFVRETLEPHQSIPGIA